MDSMTNSIHTEINLYIQRILVNTMFNQLEFDQGHQDF